MKILLVRPPLDPETDDIKFFSFMEPLALEYIAGSVIDRHEVKLLDMRVPSEPPLRQVLESFQPDILGCGAITVEVNPVKKVFAEAKKLIPELLTVVGGAHATALPSDFFEPYVDVVVVREGASTFSQIADAHENKRGFGAIGNIYARNGGDNMRFTFEQPYPELDTLPLPARSTTAHVRGAYQNRLAYTPTKTGLIRSSSGCLFKCNFCTIPTSMGQKVYKRSLEPVVEELATIAEPMVIWVDDEFLLDHKRAMTLAEQIGRAGIKKQYGILCRVSTVLNHPEVVEAWAKIGGGGLFLGFESHKNKDLQIMGKGVTVQQQKEAARIVKSNGFLMRAGFIIQPYYQRDDFESLIDYIRTVEIDYPTFSIATPLPGTLLWQEQQAELITRNYNLFDQVHVVTKTALPLKDFYTQFLSLNKVIPFRVRMNFIKGLSLSEKWRVVKEVSRMGKKLKRAHLHYGDTSI